MATVTERVAAGAALLDERKPGWFQSIDCATLDISTSDRCICGQLYGLYVAGVTELGISALEYGFTVGDSTREIINEAWREAIALRRLEHAPVPAAV